MSQVFWHVRFVGADGSKRMVLQSYNVECKGSIKQICLTLPIGGSLRTMIVVTSICGVRLNRGTRILLGSATRQRIERACAYHP